MMDDTIMNAKYSHTDALQIMRIVDYLFESLRISKNEHLIIFFYSGTKASNGGAMITWIHSLSPEPTSNKAGYQLTRRAALNDLEVTS